MVHRIKRHGKVVICAAIFLSLMVSQNVQANTAIYNDILDLVLLVEDMNLKSGIENSLDAKLEAALNALDDLNNNNDAAALHAMYVFKDAVERQKGTNITITDACILISRANYIINDLEVLIYGWSDLCPYCGGRGSCIPPCDGTGGGSGVLPRTIIGGNSQIHPSEGNDGGRVLKFLFKIIGIKK